MPALLRNRSLAALMAAEFVSLGGSSMTFVALPWFVLATTGSTARMGWVLAAELVPVGVLGIPSGAVMLAITFAIGCFLAPYYASSRLILPEIVGEDETLVAEGSAYVQAVNQLTQLAGPILAGLLIASISAATVLLIDACTYLFSFVVILTLVRAGRRAAPTEAARGIFAGVKFLARDRLLGPTLAAAAILNFVAQGLVATLPVLVFRRYGADAKVLGWFFAAFGGGELLGSMLASQLVRKVPLLRLTAVAILAMALPLWLLSIAMPWWLVFAVIAAFGFCAPLVNAPMIAVLTMRAPEALRPKVMTAVMTISGIVGPLGFLAAGVGLQYVSLTFVFLFVAAGFTFGAIAFSAAVRNGDGQPHPAVPAPA
ncbi:MAG: MFS transporter [Actinobacteria bacterium]|nr:MAG: MFS transporter [Actinomycetota bacterium]